MAVRWTVHCFARRHGDRWTAICLDFDIAIEALALREAMETLQEAIRTYVDDASKETPTQRENLLRRKTPMLRRICIRAAYRLHALLRVRSAEWVKFDFVVE